MSLVKGLKINPNKSKLMKISPMETSPINGDGDSRSGLDMMKVNGESLSETSVSRYLGIDVETFGGMKEEIDHKVA